MITERVNYYEYLGIDAEASVDDIKDAIKAQKGSFAADGINTVLCAREEDHSPGGKHDNERADGSSQVRIDATDTDLGQDRGERCEDGGRYGVYGPHRNISFACG